MQKKEIEKIPPLKTEKAAAQYKAIAVSKAIKIKKSDYLIIDIFENKKKSLSGYIVRIVLNNKEYANHFPDGSWTEQKILTKSYDYIWESRAHGINTGPDQIFISPESTRVIKNTLHKLDKTSYKTGNWYSNISSYEEVISVKRQETAEAAKEKACMERNATVQPTPEQFIEWAKSLHGAGCIYYQRKGKTAEFTCSKCGKTYVKKCIRGESYEDSLENVTEIPRKGEKATCSLCGAEGYYNHKGRCINGVYAKVITAYLIQPHNGNAAVIRQYTIERQLMVGSPERYTITEYGRYFIGSHIQQKDWNMKHWSAKEGDYIHEWSYKNNWGYYSNKDEDGYLWQGSSIQDTFLKYSQIMEYSEKAKTFKPTYYAEAYKKYPELEMIIKLKMDRLADRIVKGYQWLKIYEGSSIYERLGIRKSDMKALIKEKGDWNYLEVLRLEKEKGILLKEDERKKLRPHINSLKGNALNTALEHMTMRKFINRIEKYSGCRMEETCGYAYEQVRHTITTYLDYLSMRQTLHNDLDNPVHLYPRRINEAHAAMVRETDSKKSEAYIKQREEQYSMIKENFNEYMKKYYREKGQLFIRPAMSAEEIILEGRIQHHCVGQDNYLKKHNNKETVILFLRYKDDPDTPYVTVEADIKENKILQWYSAHDRKADKEQNDKWLSEYEKKLKKASGSPLSTDWNRKAAMFKTPQYATHEADRMKEAI